MLKDYEISFSTLIVLAVSSNESIVYEVDNELNVKKRATKIADDSCKFFGSSLIGRQEGTKTLIGTAIKAPIIVEESKEIIFFPTISPRNSNCSWVSYNNLLKYEKVDKSSTLLYFRGGKNVKVNISYNIIDNQVTRCIKLEKNLLTRKKAL